MASARHSESPGFIITPVFPQDHHQPLHPAQSTHPRGAADTPAGTRDLGRNRESAEAGKTLAASPRPWAGSVPKSGVTGASETLVCNGRSSCSARDCGPLTRRAPRHPLAGSPGHRLPGCRGGSPTAPRGAKQHSPNRCSETIAQRDRQPHVPGYL